MWQHDAREPGNHTTAVVDLDAGTTVPRVIPIVGVIVVIAGLALLLAMSHARDQATSAPRTRPAAHYTFTIPAVRTMATFAAHGAPPTPLIGPRTGPTVATFAW